MKNKIIKTSLIVISIILALICLYKITNDKVISRVIHNYSTQTLSEETKILASQVTNNTLKSTYRNAFTATSFNDWGIPFVSGANIFCIQPGAAVTPAKGEVVDYNTALGLNGTNTYYYRAEVPSDKSSNPHYVPSSGQNSLPAALTYAISMNEGDTHSEQDAVWQLGRTPYSNGIVGTGTSPHMGASSNGTNYAQEAQDYANYDALVRGKGLQPKDTTNHSEVKIKVNQDKKTYIIGPLNINYTNGVYGNVAFAGISKIKVIGYDSNKKVVSDNVKVSGFILKDKTTGQYTQKNLEYFEPDKNTLVDRTKQVYPEPNQDFQILLEESNIANMTYFGIKVEFEYMLADGAYTTFDGNVANVKYSYQDHYKQNPNYPTEEPQYIFSYRTVTATVETKEQQKLMSTSSTRNLYKEELEIKVDIPLRMDLGGKVWEDVPNGKDNLTNGKYDDGHDRLVPNVKVTLYNEDGTIAKLKEDPKSATSIEQIICRINPTYTDSNGDYLFKGLDPMKKYYVTFEYNGQIYMPTDYSLNLSEYNTDAWKVTSKGTEKVDERKSFNNKFKEIGSSPLNYVSSNSLNSGKLVTSNGKTYNETFSQFELMGLTLDSNGNYQKGTALIDGFYIIQNGNVIESNTLQEGLISTKIKEYVKANKKSPDANAMKQIYSQIAGSDSELWKKLQFIEDCKIKSYTEAQGGSYDLYPIYNQFIINNNANANYETAEAARNISYNTNNEVINGTTYRPIYPGQFSVNQGLWRRQEANVSLRKDVVYAATKINDKTEIYKYDKRKATDYWEVQLRMRDYYNYYASAYAREIYSADYTYRSSQTNQAGEDKELELYITYKITVRNSSTSIMAQIPEIVDYYDKDYTYINNLSWIMYKDNINDSNSSIALKQEDYLKTMEQLSLQGDLKTNAKKIDCSYGNSKNSNGTYTGTSQYGSVSQQDMEKQYNSLYIKGLANKKLSSGEEAYIYLTFKVNKDSNGILLDNEQNDVKENFAEINGYKTYYKDGTKLPNNQTVNSSDVAGLVDINSNPGNLCLKDLQGQNYEKNFEDDTDRAKSIKVKINNDFIRAVSGTVWEDERTHVVSGAIIGDGVRQDDEITVKGVTVQLVEILEDNKEFVWGQTTTNENGYYEFKTDEAGKLYIIPGNYIVRFQYGDTEATVKSTSDQEGIRTVSYNGQDFKSTVFEKDMTSGETLNQYDGKYDIENADKLSLNLSDAKDIWNDKEVTLVGSNMVEKYQGRQTVIDYSKNEVKNDKAEILASPYTDRQDLISELIKNTKMTAETDLIVLEGEYNRTSSDGTNATDGNKADNSKNGNYSLRNLDFGLTERPKAQLELNQKVTNVKVILANENTLFDTNKGVADLSWTAGKPYDLNSKMENKKYKDYYGFNYRYAYRTDIDKLLVDIYKNGGNGLIQVIMDEELMHGATIKIDYEMYVKNVGETDYVGQEEVAGIKPKYTAEQYFYYEGVKAGNAEVATTRANVIIDYVPNNLKFRDADNAGKGWTLIKSEDVINAEKVNKNLKDDISKNNTILKNIKLNEELKPGDKTHNEALQLTQIITTQNTEDDKSYTNLAEITDIYNSVGRRMAFSIQGNQNPASNPAEVDACKSEKVVILPPFGIGEIILYTTISVLVLVTLTGGIIFIKKKVLKK